MRNHQVCGSFQAGNWKKAKLWKNVSSENWKKSYALMLILVNYIQNIYLNKSWPEYIKSQEVLDPHELRDDTPPLAPKQRVFGRRAFGTSPDYIIPKETHNYIDTAEDILTKPATPPEGTKSGGIPSTPEPGSTSKSGYRQLQKGGKNILRDLDKMYILKMLGHYDPKKEGKVK